MESSQLTVAEWKLLIERIETGRCTPFLGAGVAAGLLPLGGVVAKKLATDHGYPFEDNDDLVKVSQYVAIAYDSSLTKVSLLKARIAGFVAIHIKWRRIIDTEERLIYCAPVPGKRLAALSRASAVRTLARSAENELPTCSR